MSAQIIDLRPEETVTHKRAFSIYSSLDPESTPGERELIVADRLHVDADEVHSWSRAFAWEQRLAQDAQIVRKGLDARSRKEKLREKVDALVNRIAKLLDKDETWESIKIDDGKALSQLASAMDKLVHTSSVLDGTFVAEVVIRSDKPISELSDEELAEAVQIGRARLAARVDDGPEAA